ncbi:MAG: DUF4886 domain-containing protein [Acutalibacteraceae bacterium]
MMWHKTKVGKVIAFFLSAVMLFAGIPFSTFAEGDGTELQLENLFRREDGTNVIASSRGIDMKMDTGEVTTCPSLTAEDVDNMHDGDTVRHEDWPWVANYYRGAEYILDDLYYVKEMVVYFGYDQNPDKYRVYASDDPNTLYAEESIIADNVDGKTAPTTIPFDRKIKCVAVVAIDYTLYNTRPKEFELYGEAKKIEAVQTENLFRREDGSDAIASSRGIAMNIAGGYVNSSDPITNVIGALSDGNTTQHNDWQTSTEWYYGAEYTLDASYALDHLRIYSALDGLPDSYRVYASETAEDLYKDESIVAASVSVTFDKPMDVEIGKTAKYVAIVGLATSGNTRPKEFQLWSEVKEEPPMELENLFRREDGTNAIASSRGIDMNMDTGEVTTCPSLTAEDIDNMHDGDTVRHEDWPWVANYYRGAEYILDDLYYVKEMVVYFGYDQNPDKYRVYASDDPNTLYAEESIIADNVDGKTAPTTIPFDRKIKCVAVVAIDYTLYNTRPKEFELYGEAKKIEAVQTENLFRREDGSDAIASSRGIAMNIAGGYVNSSDPITNVIGALSDGNTTQHNDWQTSTEWYYGAEYTLDASYALDHLRIYSALDGLPDSYRVYASETAENLYKNESIVADSVSVTFDKPVDVEIGKTAKYIAIVGLSTSGNTRPKEFQLWGAKDTGEEPKPDDSLKVLTIGNSFSENASGYASEIAAVNGRSLTFGYLKFPSCTIARHYEAAANNKAVFKFEITDPTGKRTTIKQEAANWDSPDPEKCATIQEALEYMDWDVIVFQQESNTSLDASSFADLPKLIEYVKGFCSDARLMIHEVWAWGSWENDAYKNFSIIKANYEAAAKANDLAIIPSGLGFENARKALGDYTIVNENDGHYQHANSYGKYVAGCCYVGALFGVTIDPETFKGHAEIDKEGYAGQLTAAANAAILYYSGCAEGSHNYVEKADAAYLKSAATCTKKAVYYKSCSICGEKSNETFEHGEVDSTKHGETEIRDAVAATEESEGYTGDTYCKDCGQKIASGTTIPKLEHTHNLVAVAAKPASCTANGNTAYWQCTKCQKCYADADASDEIAIEDTVIGKLDHNYSVLQKDNDNHWYKCAHCDAVTAAEAHSGGTATCTEKAVCSVCRTEYGEVDSTKHGETEIRDAVAATEESEGYTGDTYCKDCGKKIASGTTIPKLDHTHNLVKTEAKAATHYEAGNMEYYRCSACGKYYKDSAATVETTLEEVTIAKGEHSYSYKADASGHWQECECGDKRESAAHTYGEWVVTKDPTATEKGSQERVCSVCGYRETAEIDAIGGGSEPDDPSSGEQDPPVTGTDASFVMMAFVLLMSSAGIGVVAVKAKKKAK